MKRLWAKIKIFFFYLFAGMKNANDVAFTGQKDVEAGDGSGIEQQKEVNSVYKDLLRGELTQEVIELRHEMYFAERAYAVLYPQASILLIFMIWSSIPSSIGFVSYDAPILLFI